jgi:probable rRNA maturation factor
MILAVVKNHFKINMNLGKVAEAAFSVLDNTQGEIELVFVDTSFIKKLNDKYRNMDKATDVLSFRVEDNPLMGQIFICYTVARSQAKKYKTSLNDEIRRLLIHGIVHIFGYDHAGTQDRKEMEEIEQQINERVKNV